MKRPRRNLVMVARSQHRYQIRDFRKIAEQVRARAPDIVPIVCIDRAYNRFRPQLMYRPSFVVAPLVLKKLSRIRGAVAQGINLSKSDEYKALESIGVAVPQWDVLNEQHPHSDIDGLGKYVVVKPNVGGRGAEVKIKRASRVRWKPPRNQMAARLGNHELIVQRFVYTGPWPVSYRVTTLFGEPMFSWKVTADKQRRALDGPDEFGSGGEGGGGHTICSSGAGCRFELSDEEDVLELATRAHQAFPEMPILGTDIIREQPSGRLFVIELNTGGGTWHFSSSTGKSIARDFNIDFLSQFDGLSRAADVLIEQTRSRAA